MAVVKPVIYDNGLQRQVQGGDVLGSADVIASLTTAGSGTLTALLLVSGILSRTGPGGAYTDTTDSAANIINLMLGNYNYSTSPTASLSSGAAVQQGTTFKLRYLNTVAFAMTLAAGTGVILGSNTNISASSTKEYLITVLNGSPLQILTATVDGVGKVITGMTQAQTAVLSVGMNVTGTGIAASSVIASIQSGVGVTLNNNTTVAGTFVSLTFTPSIRIDSLGQMGL